MMPQEQINEGMQQQAEPDYGRYEGDQTSSARQQYETADAQELREGSSGKVYPPKRDNTNVFHFVVAVLALVLLLLFGLWFVVGIGGTAGWVSFSAACFVIACVLAYSYATMPRRR